MPYITVNRVPKLYQITFDDLINGVDPRRLEVTKDTYDTTTWCPQYINPKIKARFNFTEMYRSICEFNEKYAELIATEDKSTLYRSFTIPKRSGGRRQIDAPEDALMNALRDLKQILEEKFFFTYHTTAFAYVHGRCSVDAVRRHQKNNSRWVLKTDLSKFFPHTTPDFLFKMLYMTFPLCEYIHEDLGYSEAFEKAMSLCFLNGGLPQGTPTSPMLTNQMMIPIDHAISQMCHEHKPHLCYTRYADDMDISSEFSFHWTDVINSISDIMKKFEAPFEFNKEKIHYGSTAGRNWMLGVMLNKDGNITVGHENKKSYKNSLFAFGNAIKDGKPWSVEDTQHLQGLGSYYKMVEGETIDQIVQKYSEKFGFDLNEKMKDIVRGNLCPQI
jgi:retron-type reverse transcriptase